MTTIEKKNRNIVIKPSLIFASILIILVLALVTFLYLKAFWFIQHGGNTPGPRLDCGLEPNLTREICLNRGCLWDDRYEETQPDIPNCYFPPNTGYIATKFYEDSAILMKKQNSVKNPYGEDFNTLIFKANRIGAGLHISIYPPNVERYRPPIDINTDPNIESSEFVTVTMKNSSIFSFSVTRSSNNETIWNTEIGGLFYSDQFLQIATMLGTKNIYGLGEQIHPTLKHDLSVYKTWGMFSRDERADYGYRSGKNLSVKWNQRQFYGVHPFYLGLEKDGKAHGVFIFNSNAQEMMFGPGPHMVYRTIGGILEFFFFPGPTPEEVIQQYHQVIGKPMLPPYWAFGYHISRWYYKDLEELKKVVNRIQSHGIPLDVISTDIDVMDRYRDFTFSKKWAEFPTYMKEMQQKGLKFNLIIDPGIPVTDACFARGMKMGARFIEWPDYEIVPRKIQNLYPKVNETKILLLAAWPDDHVAYPDFLDPSGNTQKWWIEEFERFHKIAPFDAIWLDLNEPSSFSTNQEPWYLKYSWHSKITPLACPVNDSRYNSLEVPPYRTVNNFHWEGPDRPKDSPDPNYLSSKSLCMIGEVGDGKYTLYDTHNIYGLTETIATRKGVRKATGKREFVLSRSTFPSSGHYAGHWLGDNYANWVDLRANIISALEFNMFGIPMVGADVCGFNGNTTEELCLRWHQLGAFVTFYRNHQSVFMRPDNASVQSNDPGSWPTVAEATRKANLFRYRYMPYLYSRHFSAALNGGTVMRPVFFEFPNDSHATDISFQFLWGSAIMVIPVVEESVTTVNGYLPLGSTWYSLYEFNYGDMIISGNHTFEAPWTSLPPVFIRGGHIIPRQVPDMTLTATRKNDFQLLIALVKTSESPETLFAKGELFWDDGDSDFEDIEKHNFYHFLFEFYASKNNATLEILKKRDTKNLPLPPITNLEIFGYNYEPKADSLKLNDQEVLDADITPTSILNIVSSSLIDLNENQSKWVLTWDNL